MHCEAPTRVPSPNLKAVIGARASEPSGQSDTKTKRIIEGRKGVLEKDSKTKGGHFNLGPQWCSFGNSDSKGFIWWVRCGLIPSKNHRLSLFGRLRFKARTEQHEQFV